jgi:hypothetical protein
MGDIGLEEHDGIEAKAVVLHQLHSALAIIQEHQPARITTVGGECSVSMAPFTYLINKHGDDLAILWIDSTLTWARVRPPIPATTPCLPPRLPDRLLTHHPPSTRPRLHRL